MGEKMKRGSKDLHHCLLPEIPSPLLQRRLAHHLLTTDIREGQSSSEPHRPKEVLPKPCGVLQSDAFLRFAFHGLLLKHDLKSKTFS